MSFLLANPLQKMPLKPAYPHWDIDRITIVNHTDFEPPASVRGRVLPYNGIQRFRDRYIELMAGGMVIARGSRDIHTE